MPGDRAGSRSEGDVPKVRATPASSFDGTVSQRLLAIEAQQAELEAAIAGAVSDGRR